MSTRNTTKSKTDLVTYHVLVVLKKHASRLLQTPLHQSAQPRRWGTQLLSGKAWRLERTGDVGGCHCDIIYKWTIFEPCLIARGYVYTICLKQPQHRGNIVGTIRFFWTYEPELNKTQLPFLSFWGSL